MVKTVASVSHQGLRYFIIQRISAILMAIYSIFLVGYFLFHPDLSFAEWHSLFSADWMKIASIIFVICLVKHAWIGVWTIFRDYIKCTVLRGILNVLVMLALTAYFFWAFLLLWSL